MVHASIAAVTISPNKTAAGRRSLSRSPHDPTGFTLLLGWNPWLVLVTMPAHSATNLGAVRLMKQRSVILMETIVVVVSAVAFALGLLAWQR
jgi:hypothetical protein